MIITIFNENYRQKCVDFCRDIQKARADYEVACLTRMEKLGAKHFKPLQWKYEKLSAVRLQGQHKNKKRRSERHDNENSSKAI